MKYQLTINRIEDFSEEERKRLNQWDTSSGKVIQALFVEITDEEFQAVKKSVLEFIK